jgi:hypothetical protein
MRGKPDQIMVAKKQREREMGRALIVPNILFKGMPPMA